MKRHGKLKQIAAYLKSNKIAAVILMVFVFIYLINSDIFLNIMSKKISLKNTAIAKLNGRINTIKKSTGSLSAEKRGLINIENQIKILRIKLKNAEIMLPKTFMISNLIKNISLNKPAENFSIENINFGTPAKYDSVTELPINISITGGFNKTVKFIKNVNSMKRIFTIDYVSIKASKKSFPDIKADIKGYVFAMDG